MSGRCDRHDAGTVSTAGEIHFLRLVILRHRQNAVDEVGQTEILDRRVERLISKHSPALAEYLLRRVAVGRDEAAVAEEQIVELVGQGRILVKVEHIGQGRFAVVLIGLEVERLEDAVIIARVDDSELILLVDHAVSVQVLITQLSQRVQLVERPGSVVYIRIRHIESKVGEQGLVKVHDARIGHVVVGQRVREHIHLSVKGQAVDCVFRPPRLFEIEMRHLENVHKQTLERHIRDSYVVSGRNVERVLDGHDGRLNNSLFRRGVSRAADSRAFGKYNRAVEAILDRLALVVYRVVYYRAVLVLNPNRGEAFVAEAEDAELIAVEVGFGQVVRHIIVIDRLFFLARRRGRHDIDTVVSFAAGN